MHQDLPYLGLWYEDQAVALGPGVQDYTRAADGNYGGLADLRFELAAAALPLA